MDQTQGFIDQSLATCCNYIRTGRSNMAIKLMSVVKKIDPDNQMVTLLLDIIYSDTTSPQVNDEFGDWWNGESLDGKSIEVFCDQGMGDTINMLRYLDVMHERWNCEIFLNNYAYYNDLKELLDQIPTIHSFSNEHVKCDYQTNIFSIPALLSGLKYPIYYPAHFLDLLDHTDIPPQVALVPMKEVNCTLGKPIAGVTWKSNPENVLSQKKSVPDDLIGQLKEVDGWNFFSVCPGEYIADLADTAAIIDKLDVVISVDTVVLHLAGAMGKTTFGLLPYEADPRWGKEDTTVWYPSVRLFRQDKEGDWSRPIRRVKEELASLS
jgi:hypothetical protein